MLKSDSFAGPTSIVMPALPLLIVSAPFLVFEIFIATLFIALDQIACWNVN